jgi:prophage tail gpP-like protein
MNKIFIEVNGRKLEGFKSLSYTDNFEEFISTFTATYSVKELLSTNRRQPINPIKTRDRVRLFIDDNLKMTGYVQRTEPSWNASSREVTITCVDRTYDLIKSSMVDKKYFSTDFIELARNVLDDNNFKEIKISSSLELTKIQRDQSEGFSFVGDVNTGLSNKGKKIFDFLNEYNEKVQGIIRTNEFGNIEVLRESSQKTKGNLISTKNNPNNNIKEASLTQDDSKLFRFYQAESQLDNSSFTETTTSQTAIYEDTSVNSKTRKIINAKTSSTQEELLKLAKFHATLAKAQSQTYTCTVQGYYTDKQATELWRPNRLVKIVDDKNQLDGQFLIRGITFSKDVESGSTTTLRIVPRGAFSLDPDKAIQDSKSNDFGNAFLSSS